MNCCCALRWIAPQDDASKACEDMTQQGHAGGAIRLVTPFLRVRMLYVVPTPILA